MKINYNQEVDVLVVRFSDAAIHDSDELRPGFIVDYDSEGRVVRIEILDASTQVDTPFEVAYRLERA